MDWHLLWNMKVGQEKWDARLIANYRGDEKVQDWNSSSPTYGKAFIDKGDFTVMNLKALTNCQKP